MLSSNTVIVMQQMFLYRTLNYCDNFRFIRVTYIFYQTESDLIRMNICSELVHLLPLLDIDVLLNISTLLQ